MRSNFTQILAGAWKLAIDPANAGRAERWFDQARPESVAAPVPGVIQQVFPAYHGVAWYWHTFRAHGDLGRADSAAERLRLHFGAVDYLAEVWLNGHHLGSCEGGEAPFEFDVTGLVRAEGDNLLAVRVLNPTETPIDGYVLTETPHSNKTAPPRAGSGLNTGGIRYPVTLRQVPAVSLSDVFVRPDWQTGQITVTITVANGLAAAASGTLTLAVAADNGEVLDREQFEANFAAGLSTHEAALHVSQPHAWNLEDPYLYRVTIALQTLPGKTPRLRPHQLSVRCGFRDFRVVDGYFHLNGQRLFLKSTHTGTHLPSGNMIAAGQDFIRRDLVYAKAAGFNMVRFIAGMAYPEQLDFCDEIGLMVYEECLAAWLLADSPWLGERYDRNTSAMILRDRNHPSVTIWGLLNETRDSPTYRHAVGFLPTLRRIDPTRLVLLSSGRWDADAATGSVSNPGSSAWEPVWGDEDPNPSPIDRTLRTTDFAKFPPLAYVPGAGDAHVYPQTPLSPRVVQFMHDLGRDSKPVFLSEFGFGSLQNVITEWRHFEQAGARTDLEDGAFFRTQAEAFAADWKRLGFDDVYPFPEDMLRESQRLHARQRAFGFDLIRANPKLCGYNLTGMLDHGLTGEGLWTFFREWKPSAFDAVADGWSPLRWCLFADPLHSYSGRAITVEAVLANDNALRPGVYPARFRILGPRGVVWEKTATVKMPDPAPLAVPVLRETIRLDSPAGQYTFAASLEQGGAPSGGRLTFHLSDPASLPQLSGDLSLWGVDSRAESWLTAHGLSCHSLGTGLSAEPELILAGRPPDSEITPERWETLTAALKEGATGIFLNPAVFRHGEDSTAFLPLPRRGKAYTAVDWLYHKECVTRRHPVFEGLQTPGIMDWDYYGPVIPHEIYEGLDTPDETLAASFATGHHRYPTGYSCGLLMAAYRCGAGRLILSTPYLLENLDVHPAADRMLLNLIRYAQAGAMRKKSRP